MLTHNICIPLEIRKIEALLLGTRSIGFHGEIRKILNQIAFLFNSGVLWYGGNVSDSRSRVAGLTPASTKFCVLERDTLSILPSTGFDPGRPACFDPGRPACYTQKMRMSQNIYKYEVM